MILNCLFTVLRGFVPSSVFVPSDKPTLTDLRTSLRDYVLFSFTLLGSSGVRETSEGVRIDVLRELRASEI